MSKYKNVFKPCVLKNGTILKNRIAYPNAQQSFMSGPENFPPESLIEDTAIFARSGASLMSFGHFGSHGGGAAPRGANEAVAKAKLTYGLEYDYRRERVGSNPVYDYSIPRTYNYVGQVAAVAHMYGTKVLVKVGASFPKGVSLEGGDPKTLFPAPDGDDRLATLNEIVEYIPQVVSWLSKGKGLSMEQMKSNAATKEQIQDAIDDLVELCRSYQKAGWDGISIRADRWGLDSSTNIRDDEYGGEIEGRGRFQLELFTKIKEYCGPDFLIEVVMMGESPHGHDGQLPAGYTEEEFIRFMKMVEDVSDIVEIRELGGTGYQCLGYNSLLNEHPSLGYAKHLRQAGYKGTIAVNGGFNDPDEMEQILSEGIVDLISTGRTFRAEPDFMAKLRSNGQEEFTPCLRCNKCHGFHEGVCGCSVNPKDAMHHRLPAIIKPPGKPKKVAIIGGGPVGLRTACFAAERGHSVTIFEKDGKLGGKAAYYAGLYPAQWPMKRYLDWLIDELSRRGVTDIRLNTEADPLSIAKEGFDALLAATGSREKRPPIEGADQEGVWLDEDVYLGNVEPGEKVVIVGGGSVASETAMYLASLGKDVIIITRQEVLMKGEFRMHGPHMSFQVINEELGYGGTGGAWTKYENLKPIYHATATKVTPTQVTYLKEGVETTIDADTVIVSGGYTPCAEEALKYADCTDEFYIIGDADKNCTSLLEGNRRGFGKVCLL
ncbi:MAG: FAD-dependent oxidoreductase [Lachnospiraceae bacterium]|jgi:2,4-dienoyl-CoA reductase-like NADH-dependent reductase (Old Yellow Enzyme family)/thioredoxin reductase|nr:FAD-dependent oxidoreductase [Lachnospiraceae bacterium]